MGNIIYNNTNLIVLHVSRMLAYYADGFNDFIVLEDLTDDGYVGIKRDTGLDFNHAHSIMRQFAKFHGLSYAFKQENPDKFQELISKLTV